MPAAGDDLDLLLSLQEDRVLETPPGSPSSLPSHLPGYASDDGSPKPANMSVFRDAVKDYLEAGSINVDAVPLKPKKPGRSGGEVVIEKFSGLRIRNALVCAVELSNRFSEIRFVRLPTIRNLLAGDTLSGCWATVGVLTEKGEPRLSSTRKTYSIWKMSCLDESTVSVFLFGDAYAKNSGEVVGTVFALFNSAVRRDAGGKGFSGFSLSVYTAGQIIKIGTSVDYGICKGKRKDGVACTMIINKRVGAYCKYHLLKSSQRYTTTRAELKGGNIQTYYRPPSEGVYMVDPLADRSNLRNPVQKVRVLSVDGLKRALSKADKVTSNNQSQGKRFLAQVTASLESKSSSKPNKVDGSGKRPSLASKVASNIVIQSKQPEPKRKKTNHASGNTIELEIFSSDEEG